MKKLIAVIKRKRKIATNVSDVAGPLNYLVFAKEKTGVPVPQNVTK